MDALRIGSEEHKRVLCRVFVETHDPYDPARIDWPELDAETLARLKGLPVWDEGLRTETATALKVRSLGEVEADPVFREAIAMQGYEEARHAQVIRLLTERYGIETAPFPAPERPKNPTWAFIRTGYGECLDSFFAFGLFELGRRSAFFPPKIIDVFDAIMQEEARHILFIVNWAAYLSKNTALPMRPFFRARLGWNIVAQAFDRARGAMSMAGAKQQDGFAMKSHASFGDFSPRAFLDLCLAENDRRLAPYDPRLLRPGIVPPMARFAAKVLPRPKAPPPEEVRAA